MATDLHTTWGKRLRARRKALGLSQMVVATRAKTDKGYYARLERGVIGARGPSDDMRMRLAKALETEVTEIFVYPQLQANAKNGRRAAS